MTGFLNLDQLRAHEVPWVFGIGTTIAADARARLTACWHRAQDGRLIRHWRIDTETEPEQSG